MEPGQHSASDPAEPPFCADPAAKPAMQTNIELTAGTFSIGPVHMKLAGAFEKPVDELQGRFQFSSEEE